MAAIEVGTWHSRAGYVGDVACTRSLRSLALPGTPEELDFMSMILSQTEGKSRNAEKHQNEEINGDTLLQLWSLRSFQDHPEEHMAYLRHLKTKVLACDSLSDPLTLVVPEAWHERLDIINGIFELVLEDGGITDSLYCIRPSVCWALASGKASAVVLDVGHSHTTVTGVLDGYALRHTVDSSAVGGAAVTAEFSALATPFLSTFVEAQFPALAGRATRQDALVQDHVADLKHGYGFVSVGKAPSSADSEKPIEVLKAPDGSTLSLTAEQRSAPFELYFGRDPERSAFNVADALVRCKRRVDPEWQVRTVHHVFAGAGALVKGFADRLMRELKEKDAAYFRYERDSAFAKARSAAGAWMGASMAAASSSFDPMWVTRAEWEEEGESVLYRKLFY